MNELEKKLLDSLVRSETGCWLWQGPSDKDGYGTMYFDGASRKTHRMAYLLYCGSLETSRCVCHSCDTPSCCNPAHLFLGSDADNAHDRDAKGHGPRGEKNRCAKLTAEEVLRIRALLSSGMTQKAVATMFGLHRGNVSHIARGKSWSHLV